MKTHAITVRVSDLEHKKLVERAKAANLSINRFIIQSALQSPPPSDKKLSDLMGQLCRLDVHLRRTNDCKELKQTVCRWRNDTIRMLGGA